MTPTPDPKTGPELLPCPFCGRKDAAMECREDRTGGPLFWIRCGVLSCGGRTAKFESIGSARSAWNRRSSLPAFDAVVKALDALLDGGPYQDDDGCCSFCQFAPNDSEDLAHLKAHEGKCEWRVAKEVRAAMLAEKGRGK